MSQAPSMPMYWDAYLADTTHLTTEEHGAYLLLLGAMWRRNGSVPDDDKDNARILGLTKGRWIKVKSRLSEFLIIENGDISQKKLQKTWKNTQEKIQTNRSNGSKGGRPRSNENNDLAKAKGSVSHNPNHNPNVTIPEPEPEPLEKRTTDVVQKKTASRLPDDWFLPVAWGEWALSEGLDRDAIKIEADTFKDYWLSLDGQKAAKLDWLRVWRNWIRNSKQRKSNGNGNRNGNGPGGGNRPDEALEQIARLARTR